MRFQPKTEKEAAEANLYPKGDYDFEVLEAEDTKSNAGNDMIKLKARVFSPDGTASRTVTDYLLEAMAFKLRHFAACMNVMAQYEEGRLSASDLVGRVGRCSLDIEPESKGKDGKTFPPKNVIKDYLVPAGAGGNRPVREPGDDNPFGEDEIPL